MLVFNYFKETLKTCRLLAERLFLCSAFDDLLIKKDLKLMVNPCNRKPEPSAGWASKHFVAAPKV